ncbi:NAD(P)/FAD-dependent oxidoreductase [Pollutimonas bauzanensis]|nr:FAD-dependent oxidoreductase [Pollutimonas bauzanensis]
MPRHSGVYDVAVVGGGLVGSAIAYGLRRSLDRIAVLDEDDVAFRASRGNAGLVWVQGKGLGLAPYGNWTQSSAALWPRLATELHELTGIDVHLEQPGGLHPAFSDAEFDARRQAMALLMAQPGMTPYPWQMLDRQQVADLVPGIGPALRGASWTPRDGTVNPLKLLRALHAAFACCGVDYLPGHGVQSITQSNGVFKLVTARDVVRAKLIVLAAGLGNRRLGAEIGLDVPVRPQRGQVIVLERTARTLPIPFTTLRQMDEGSWIIGDAHEEAGYADKTTGLPVLATLADRALMLLPALQHVRAVRTWAALRVMSQDGFPIYEQSRTHPGAFIATCHSGVTLAAAHAFRFSAMVAAGAVPSDLDAFSTRRFHVPQPA